MPTSQFRFRPPDRRMVWRNLALTMSQAAALTGVSERQIQHWMDQGYIKASNGPSRKINGACLDKIMLIKQGRAAGIPLRRAVALADDYLSEQAAAGIEPNDAGPALYDLRERLRNLSGEISGIQQLLDEVQGDGRRARRTLPNRVKNGV